MKLSIWRVFPRVSIRDHRSLTTRSWRKLPYRVGLLANSYLTPSSFACDASFFQTQLFGKMFWKKITSQSPRYNEPPHNEVHGTTNDFLYSSKKSMKNNLDITRPPYSEQKLSVPWPFVISRFHCKKHTRETLHDYQAHLSIICM